MVQVRGDESGWDPQGSEYWWRIEEVQRLIPDPEIRGRRKKQPRRLTGSHQAAGRGPEGCGGSEEWSEERATPVSGAVNRSSKVKTERTVTTGSAPREVTGGWPWHFRVEKEGLPWWLRGSVCNAADPDSIPGSGRSPGEGNGYPLRYSCLENSMDRGAWQATVHGITELSMTEWLTLSFFTIILQKKLYEQKNNRSRHWKQTCLSKGKYRWEELIQNLE